MLTKMEKRINKKVNDHMSQYKTFIKEKLLNFNSDSMNKEEIVNLVQIFYDYPTLILSKDDFQKRKRIKNIVPLHERCCALKAANEQCTRRKKANSDYCGTHIKGIPHGVINKNIEEIEDQKKERTLVVTAHDFSGIIYYIDDDYNVYDTIDIHNNITNPKIIAKYTNENGLYKIPDFNI